MRKVQKTHAAWAGILALGSLAACSSSSTPPPPPGGTGSSGASSGGSTAMGSGSGSGGAASSGSTSGSGSGPANDEAGAPSSGAGSGAQVEAGTGSGSSGGGGADAGGTGSGAPSADAGGVRAEGGVAADKTVAQVLDGYAILKPCTAGWKTTPNPNGDCCCQETPADENQHHTQHFGGDPSVLYNVTLRIAGVAERYWYEGGMLDPTSKLFYTGGLPTIHSAMAPNTNLRPGSGACKIHPPQTDGQFALPFAVPVEINPSDGCFNGFNIFAVTVSAPKQSYYLNYTTEFDHVDRQPHRVYTTDYTVTIPISGQAQLDFYTIDGDHHEVSNDGTMMVPNVKTAQPYIGNFLEFTVLGVTRAN